MRILTLDFGQQACGARIVGLPGEGKMQIADNVIVTGINLRVVWELVYLFGESRIERFRVAAVVAIPGAGIEHRITSK